ncbi:hypothetical protein DIX90_09040 [Streptococcus iniae]|uniref:hypothetical protein n=1 Tax=Streptococcus iniae TaxID=1346 RepID=UPI000EF6C212|nr:hypothetical protein [Streptococcus iniae]RLU51566.1 hypothetical protein DIY04_10560 [Streptococcus iniae]RLU58564.1 hypothetical protein DIY02_09025 [Streptococcus iniae]RLU60556.1 hypothetical protein DIY01_08845 [Streptococcus iniae]RLU68716.1 hypothetical protein DIX97_09155 [Streptococcus iniae]RLU82706.1 hypothetical protein DIX91_08810 [Streptococcus iniae]
MNKMRNISDWELQSWESATKYRKKTVVKLFESCKSPIIKTNIDFFEAMRLTKNFTLMGVLESEHKITFEYGKKDDTQDYLDELKKESIKIIRDLELRSMYYKLDKRVSELEYLKDNDEVKIVIDGHELTKASVEFTDRGSILKCMRGDI